jgi:hypothetical protein
MGANRMDKAACEFETDDKTRVQISGDVTASRT